VMYSVTVERGLWCDS